MALIADMPDANANARAAAFDRREIGFERRARRILRARVLEALVLAELRPARRSTSERSA